MVLARILAALVFLLSMSSHWAVEAQTECQIAIYDSIVNGTGLSVGRRMSGKYLNELGTSHQCDLHPEYVFVLQLYTAADFDMPFNSQYIMGVCTLRKCSLDLLSQFDNIIAKSVQLDKEANGRTFVQTYVN